MDPIDTTLVAALLRGITDEFALNAPMLSGDESIPQLIERVCALSAQAQARMRTLLASAFPDIGWSDSEDKADTQVGDLPHWVYDPIDGAYHYLQGLPLWSSSLALVKGGKAIAAFVYDPTRHELFIAQAGKGATLNGQPIKVASKSQLRTAVVGTALPPYTPSKAQEHVLAARLLVRTCREVFVVRQMAAASLQLAYVAVGRLDAYVEVGDDLYDWLAGSLLVQEAGGVSTALDGTPLGACSQGVLSASGSLHPALKDALSDF